MGRRSLLRLLIALLGLLGAGPWGCGYHLLRGRQALGGARTVAIRGFRNETAQPGLDSLVTDAVHREFARRGDLRLVRDPEQADLVISGQVVRMQVRSRSFSSIQFALEYEVWLQLAVEVQRRDGRAVHLDARDLSESERYLASADLEVSRTNRQEALRRLAGLLATRLHDALYVGLIP